MKSKLLGLLCTLLLSCNGQNNKKMDKIINNTIVMKKLDSAYLNKLGKINNKNEKVNFTEGDTIIELTNRSDNFLETRRKINDSAYSFFTYDKKTNLMIASGDYFYNIPIGVFKRYNENGELIEEINRDQNFSFSITELIDKIKVTHKIDLNNTTKVEKISRNFDKTTNKYLYTIIYKNDKNEESKCLSIDGKTGEILGDVTVSIIR